MQRAELAAVRAGGRLLVPRQSVHPELPTHDSKLFGGVLVFFARAVGNFVDADSGEKR